MPCASGSSTISTLCKVARVFRSQSASPSRSKLPTLLRLVHCCLNERGDGEGCPSGRPVALGAQLCSVSPRSGSSLRRPVSLGAPACGCASLRSLCHWSPRHSTVLASRRSCAPVQRSASVVRISSSVAGSLAAALYTAFRFRRSIFVLVGQRLRRLRAISGLHSGSSALSACTGLGSVSRSGCGCPLLVAS